MFPRTLKGKIAKQYPEAFVSKLCTSFYKIAFLPVFYLKRIISNHCTDINECSNLEDDDDELDPIPSSVATTITNTATSEQSTESCDTSPDVISPTISCCSEDPSQENVGTPTSDSPEQAVLRDEGPDSAEI